MKQFERWVQKNVQKEEIKKQLEAIKKNREIIEEEYKKYIEDRNREKEEKKAFVRVICTPCL